MVGRSLRAALPAGGGRDRRRADRGRGSQAPGRLRRRVLRAPRAARSWASPAWSAPAAPRSPRPSSASTRSTPAACSIDGARFKPRSRARRSGAASPTCRRTAGEGLFQPMSIFNISSLAMMRGCRRSGSCGRPPSARLARLFMEQLSIQASGPRRSSAGSRAATSRRSCSAVARRRSGHADPRRADPWHRRRHQGRVHAMIASLAAAGNRDPDDLLRLAGGPRHGRPRPGHARRPAWWRVRTGRCDARERDPGRRRPKAEAA